MKIEIAAKDDLLPHTRAWLDTSGDVPQTVSFLEKVLLAD
jgi:hypothetical protein